MRCADLPQFYVDNRQVVARSLPLLPRALARGLEWENNLGVLTPHVGNGHRVRNHKASRTRASATNSSGKS